MMLTPWPTDTQAIVEKKRRCADCVDQAFSAQVADDLHGVDGQQQQLSRHASIYNALPLLPLTSVRVEALHPFCQDTHLAKQRGRAPTAFTLSLRTYRKAGVRRWMRLQERAMRRMFGKPQKHDYRRGSFSKYLARHARDARRRRASTTAPAGRRLSRANKKSAWGEIPCGTLAIWMPPRDRRRRIRANTSQPNVEGCWAGHKAQVRRGGKFPASCGRWI